MKKILNIRSVIPLIFSVAVMIAIFNFSAQDGGSSNNVSFSFSRLFCKILFTEFDEMTAEQQLFIISGINYFVRKLAHFSAYAALGLCSYLFFYFSGIRLGGVYPPAILLCAGYAVFDEVHQLFTPGRSIKFTDMLLDTAGAAFGAAIALVAAIVVLHIKNTRADKTQTVENTVRKSGKIPSGSGKSTD